MFVLMKHVADKDLFKFIQQNNNKAFEELLTRYERILFDLIFKRTLSEADTKDILQDIFISFWKNRHSITIDDSIYPYLHRAAKYAIIDLMVRNKKVIDYQNHLTITPSRQTSVEDKIFTNEITAQMHSEVLKMPTTMKEIFLLSRKQHLSTKEIAEQLSLSEQTVRNNISLALQRLRKRFKTLRIS